MAKMSVVCVVLVEDATENQLATHNARAKVRAERRAGDGRFPAAMTAEMEMAMAGALLAMSGDGRSAIEEEAARS